MNAQGVENVLLLQKHGQTPVLETLKKLEVTLHKNELLKGYLFHTFRLMFEGTDTDKRMYLHRLSNQIPELKELSKKYPYKQNILREEKEKK